MICVLELASCTYPPSNFIFLLDTITLTLDTIDGSELYFVGKNYDLPELSFSKYTIVAFWKDQRVTRVIYVQMNDWRDDRFDKDVYGVYHGNNEHAYLLKYMIITLIDEKLNVIVEEDFPKYETEIQKWFPSKT